MAKSACADVTDASGRRAKDGQRVRRRQVFFVPGYDPHPARRYRELYRKEAASQSAISGYRIAVTGTGRQGWAATAVMETAPAGAAAAAAPVETQFEVLRWNDIVRGNLDGSIARIYLRMARTLWRYLASGALLALIRLRPAPMVAALAPVGFMILYLLAAGLVGWVAFALTALVGLPVWAGLPAAVLSFLAVMAATRRLEPWLFTYYLMSDFAHVASAHGAWPPDLDRRMVAFCERIAQALSAPFDEVLIVGHSSGAQIAVSLTAELLSHPGADRLALLTLGQSVPMTSFLPKADTLRADLRRLAVGPAPWLDVSAPGDGAAFALCDPVSVSGVAPPGQRWPVVMSAAFRQTLSVSRMRQMRWRYFRRHIQYLCAFDHPGDYDYFAITAGPIRLAERIAGRRSSPSRRTGPSAPIRHRAA
ncbi:MAG: hypothetical protein AAGC92_09560 [Pseudomonadota bacterium]